MDDEAQLVAQVALEATAEACSVSGLTDAWRTLIQDVYSANLDRYEPDELGDTPLTLGIQCSDNLKTRAIRRFALEDNEPTDRHWHIDGLHVSSPGNTLTFSLGSTRVVTMKTPFSAGRTPLWDHIGDWEQDSQIRLSIATENSRVLAYQTHPTSAFTLFPHSGCPGVVRNYMLLWAGEPDSPSTAGWLGIPVLGDSAFIARKQLWWDEVPTQIPTKTRSNRGPHFDERRAAAPEVTLKQRRRDGQA
ncbi:hypothetical protein ACHIPZ_10395 [Antrihabitans sp. NCIMB 15449]|uniref:Uncharacterized protein n=1 Tax=Antrihabitans spumae TaxID=3373370 RepID=A0ABW7JLJ3_9NOCA